LKGSFCVSALERALRRAVPDIFNSDQGSQFTSQDFTGRRLSRQIRISMDGKRRAFDNIFVERLWPLNQSFQEWDTSKKAETTNPHETTRTNTNFSCSLFRVLSCDARG